MNVIVGLIIFALGFVTGGIVVVMITQAYKIGSQVVEKLTLATPISPRRPIFEIPVTLDSRRVDAVGLNQALHEEAARIAKLN